jgi:hypothetical protein
MTPTLVVVQYHALDTEVSHINVKTQTPVGHGRVICLSIFCGPDVNFADCLPLEDKEVTFEDKSAQKRCFLIKAR